MTHDLNDTLSVDAMSLPNDIAIDYLLIATGIAAGTLALIYLLVG